MKRIAEFQNTIEFEEVCDELKDVLETITQYPLSFNDIENVEITMNGIFTKRGLDFKLLFIKSKEWLNVSLVGVKEVDKMFLIAYSYWKKFRELEASIDMKTEKENG